jgi:hypothetical protein
MNPQFCTRCGAPLPDNAQFCGTCGAPVGTAPPAPAPAFARAPQIPTTAVVDPAPDALPGAAMPPMPPDGEATAKAHLAEGREVRGQWITKGFILSVGLALVVAIAGMALALFSPRWLLKTTLAGTGFGVLAAVVAAVVISPRTFHATRPRSLVLCLVFGLPWAALLLYALPLRVLGTDGSSFVWTAAFQAGPWLFATAPIGGALWLTLRRRSGIEFLSLVPSALMTVLVFGVNPGYLDDWSGFELPRRALGLTSNYKMFGIRVPDLFLGGSFPFGAYLAQGFLVMIALALPIAVAAWVASIPALRSAEGRRLAKAAQRRADAEFAAQCRAEQMTVTPGQPVYVMAPPQSASTNTFAVVSMVLGIMGGTILPIIFGHIARRQIHSTGEKGNGMALTGLILGYIELGIVVILFIVFAVALARVS